MATNGKPKAFKNTNKPKSKAAALTNRPVSGKAQGNSGNTNIKKIKKLSKSIATAPTGGGGFKSFIGQ